MNRLRQLWPSLAAWGRAAPPIQAETVILDYNTLWGDPLDARQHDQLPPGCIITTDRRYLPVASAVVFHVPALHWLPRRKPRRQLWVAWSLECEVNYPRLRDPEFLRHIDLTMTYRRNADIPTSYVGYFSDAGNLAGALARPPRPKTPDRLLAMFISSRFNRSNRLEYASELMRSMDVHSYGRFRRNCTLVNDNWRPTKLDVIAGYKFTVAFENAFGQDYVTEKFFDPLVMGSVPIYLGAPNVDEFAPADHCYINAADFPEPRRLAEYLLSLNADDAAYEGYHAWRSQPFRTAFEAWLSEQQIPAVVRLCERVRLETRHALQTSDLPTALQQ